MAEEKVKEKIYCGDREELPDGYDRFGSRRECLNRGFGVGVFGVSDAERERMLKNRRPLNEEQIEKIAFQLGVRTGGKNPKALIRESMKQLDKMMKSITK